MKKVLLAVIVALLIVAPVAGIAAPAKDPAAAAVLSTCLSGMGEWYNADFRGNYPWGECIVGYICPCVHISSVIDAAAGKSDTAMRLDFWSNPHEK
jgi:hypothetical protein